MTIYAYQCQECNDIVFSRARHDCRSCSCGNLFVDGGFDYARIGYKKTPPIHTTVSLEVGRQELYDDWNFGEDKFGLVKPGEQ